MSQFKPFQRVSFGADAEGKKLYGYIRVQKGFLLLRRSVAVYLVDTDTLGLCAVDARDLSPEPMARRRARGLRP